MGVGFGHNQARRLWSKLKRVPSGELTGHDYLICHPAVVWDLMLSASACSRKIAAPSTPLPPLADSSSRESNVGQRRQIAPPPSASWPRDRRGCTRQVYPSCMSCTPSPPLDCTKWCLNREKGSRIHENEPDLARSTRNRAEPRRAPGVAVRWARHGASPARRDTARWADQGTHPRTRWGRRDVHPRAACYVACHMELRTRATACWLLMPGRRP